MRFLYVSFLAPVEARKMTSTFQFSANGHYFLLSLLKASPSDVNHPRNIAGAFYRLADRGPYRLLVFAATLGGHYAIVQASQARCYRSRHTVFSTGRESLGGFDKMR